jgi:release factor glutamine methyltransferase
VAASPFAAVTVREALDSAVTAIGAAGSDTPRLDAELLLAEALGVDRTRLAMEPGAPVTGPAVRAYQELVRRRSAGREPVAYLLGRRGFRRLELTVDPRVLVPRPETEHVVETALRYAPPGARVVDVGTGSGAIALALKDERPDLQVTGSDVSADALAVARANGERLGLDVTWVQADLVPRADWDVVVSNPPYVRTDEPLAPELRHEPPGALLAGVDGLEVLRGLVRCRVPVLIVEVGAGQAIEVARLAHAEGFLGTEMVQDLAGHERVVVAWR